MARQGFEEKSSVCIARRRFYKSSADTTSDHFRFVVPSGTNSQETKEARENRAVLQPLAAGCETLPSSQVPPRGVELLRYLSGYSANSSELSADVSADSLNPEQLAAMLRDLDRSELEQLLLTLLSKAESASE